MKLRTVLLFFTLIALTGTIQAQLFGGLKKVQNAPLHAGISRTFDHGYKPVVTAARESMMEGGLSMESSSKIDANTFMMIGSRRANVTSWGEVVRIVVTKEGDEQTTVRVYTQRRVKVNITAKADFANTILSNIDLKLNDDF
ncbi:MAG: hypothetical protein AAF824_25840 [Bacteroidota bacterium]